jgi:predicted MFS family arabinose efflux permease
VTRTGRPRPRALAALAPVYLSVLLFVMGAGALQVLVPLQLSSGAGLRPAAIGTVVAVYGAASLAARLPAGMAFTAARGRLFVLAGGLASAVAFALVPLAHAPLVLAAIMAINGLGWSIATTAQLALLVARPPLGMSTAAAMGWFSGATGLGNAAAGLVGGACADLVGLRATFFVLAATPLVGALLTVRAVAGSQALAGRPEVRNPPRPWRALGRMPRALWAGVLVMFYINALNAITNTFHPVLAFGAGLSLTQIRALSSIRSWASSSSRLGSGPLFARVDPAGLTFPLVIAGTVATSLIPGVVSSFALSIPLFVLAGLSRGLLRVTGSADAFDSVDADDAGHGMAAALLYGGLDVGKLAGPIVGGAIAGLWGVATMLRVVPVAFLVVYLVLALPARRGGRVRRPISPPARP